MTLDGRGDGMRSMMDVVAVVGVLPSEETTRLTIVVRNGDAPETSGFSTSPWTNTLASLRSLKVAEQSRSLKEDEER